jgi:CubicO group peptidase (beta-lactamase class C family)
MAMCFTNMANIFIECQERFLMDQAGISGISVSYVLSDGSLSTFVLGTIDSTQCGFLKMREEPSAELLATFKKSYYILTPHRMLYYNRSQNCFYEVELSKSQLDALGRNFVEPEIDLLSKDELETIETITTHQHKSPSSKVKKETVFGAAALSKPVFAYLVLKLIQENKEHNQNLRIGRFNLNRFGLQKFDLQTPLYKILPGLSEGGKLAEKITAEMILSHTTGIPMGIENQAPIFLFEPGSKYMYNGIPLIYLQLAIEKLTGNSLEELAKFYVFKPLHMNKSSFLKKSSKKSHKPETQNPSNTFFPIDFNQLKSKASCSLQTTSSDYAKFATAWVNDKLLKQALNPVIFMTKEHIPKEWPVHISKRDLADLSHVAWGLGIGLETDEEGKPIRAYHAGGDVDECRAWVVMNLEDNSAVTYFANSQNGHVLAEQFISPHISLNHAFNHFFQTFGFARTIEELEGITNLFGLCPNRFKHKGPRKCSP